MPEARRGGESACAGTLALALALCAGAVADDTERGQIEALFGRWKAAVEARDLDRVMAFYTPDFMQSGMDRSLHRSLYRTEFASIEGKKGTLTVTPEVRKVRLRTPERRIRIADVELIVTREERWGQDERRVDRIFLLVRLRHTGGGWRLCGDGSRTLPLVQVGYDGRRTQLILTARSAHPHFPLKTVVQARRLGEVVVSELHQDVLGIPYVRRRLFVRTPPPVGREFTFRTPYPTGLEVLKVPVRSVVRAVPEITAPARDFDIERWPVRIAWKDVNGDIRDFNCYEVHIRRADNDAKAYLFRSIPAGRSHVLLGETERQRRAFSEPHVPYIIEVYAYDAYGNFGLSRRRVYNLVGGDDAAKENRNPTDP